MLRKIKTHIGVQIKKIRIFKGLNQEELAEKIYKTRALISYIEQTGKISNNTFIDILKVFNMSENEFNYFGKTNIDILEFEELKKENTLLKDRNLILEELVKTQIDLIKFLKDKNI